jgi:hypothetical protein
MGAFLLGKFSRFFWDRELGDLRGDRPLELV